jgi:hypothetical protein
VRGARVGAIALGATTYRMFSEYWPTPTSRNELVAERDIVRLVA